MKTIIHNWREIRWNGAPCLTGRITDHPDSRVGQQGNYSITSPIVERDDSNGTITTESGTVYVLGEKHE